MIEEYLDPLSMLLVMVPGHPLFPKPYRNDRGVHARQGFNDGVMSVGQVLYCLLGGVV